MPHSMSKSLIILHSSHTKMQFPFTVRSEQVEYMFNLSSVTKSETILTAELHLFKLRPQVTSPTFNRHHYCQVIILQVVNVNQCTLN